MLRAAALTALACALTLGLAREASAEPPVVPAAPEPSVPSAPMPAAAQIRPATATNAAPSARRAPENPIVARDLPDPSVRNVGGPRQTLYMVGTTQTPDVAHDGAIPILRSRAGLSGFRQVGTVFPAGQVPSWAKQSFWAPELHRVGGAWAVYYTARDANGRLNIGAAFAKHVNGPYTDLGRPLVHDTRTGVIDPTHFRDPQSGKHYLVWKLDGNDVKQPTPIYIQEMAPDGRALVGKPRELIRNDQAWEGINVEAPSMVHHDGYYYLFYAGNMYDTDKYAVGVARSRSPLGPFEKAAAPILQSSAAWVGPGHGGPVTVRGQEYFVYHAWPKGKVGDQRMVLADELTWKDGWPLIGKGTPSGAPPPPPR